MKKNNLANQKVIRSITLGLAAFMALQSPMAVFAEEGGDPAGDPAPAPDTTTEETAAPVDVEQGVADAAQNAAEALAEAIGDPQVLDVNTGNAEASTDTTAPTTTTDTTDTDETTPGAENASTAENVSTPETVADSVADVLEAGDATVAMVTEANKPANEAKVEEAAQALENVVENDEKAGVIRAAATDVKDVQYDLIVAENAVVDSNAAAIDVTDNFQAAMSVAELVDQTSQKMDQALKDADNYIETINNAGSVEEAQQAKADIDKLVNDLAEDMKLKREAYDGYVAQYNTAKDKLKAAEERFNKAIGHATSEVADAGNQLKAAQDTVEALDEQIEIAISSINTQNTGALAIIKKLDTVEKDGSGNWDHQRDLFNAILVNYPGMVDDGAENITVLNYNNKDASRPTVNGDNGKFHYFKVTYDVTVQDEDGSSHVEPRVKYYNYDRADKNKVLMDGTSKNIIIYEKTEQEIGAINYLMDYLKTNKQSYTTLADGLRVFTYKDANGADAYVLKKELENNKLYEKAEVDGKNVYYAKNADGTTGSAVFSEDQLSEVIQNQNNKFNNGENDQKYKLDVQGDDQFKAFLEAHRNGSSNALLTQYTEYQKQVKEAKSSLETAQSDVTTLTNAISAIADVTGEGEEMSVVSDAGRLTLAEALTALEVSEKQWKQYLGLDSAAADGLSLDKLLSMPVRDALSTLDDLLGSAEKKLEAAESKLATLQQKKEKAGEDLTKTINRLTPRPAADDDDNADASGVVPGDGGSTGGVDGGSTAGTPANPAAPAGGRAAAEAATADAEGGAPAGNGGILGAGNGGAAAAGNGGILAGVNAGDDGVIIGDGETALAESIEEATTAADETHKKDENIRIADENTALANAFDEETATKGWPWWILALITGAVTFEEFMTRQRRNRKAEQE